MHFLLFRSSSARLARPSSSMTPLIRTVARPTRSYAQQSYGGDEMSGHPKSDKANPKADMEHPGPKSPASKGTASTSRNDDGSSSQHSSSSSSSSSVSATPEGGSSQSHQETSHGGRPAINNPGPAPQSANEGVKKHNEEVANRHDTVDQDGGDDKVEKGFWSGWKKYEMLEKFCVGRPIHSRL